MKYLLLLSVFFYCCVNSFSQNNALVIRNDAFIVINGGTNGSEAVLVVNQPHANGIVTSGTGGNIITQGEFDYVKWNVGIATGTHTVPLTSDVGNVKIPVSVNISSAGTGNGYIVFSTWDVSAGAGQFDNTPWPSDVTHMAGANGVPDNSDYAVDRFWIIDINDPLGTGETYSVNPTPILSFGYNLSAAETADGNNLSVGLLGAQHFDPVSENWHGSSSGITATGIWGVDNGLGLVSNVTPPLGEWYRTWTLSDYSSPLPVELLSFNADCESEGTVLTWQSASELSNDHFEIYRSDDGRNFYLIGSVDGIGNSTEVTEYSFLDAYLNSSGVFYRLSQVNTNGIVNELSNTFVNSCLNDNGSINIFQNNNGQIVINWESTEEGYFQVKLFDALGKLISQPKQISINSGFNHIELDYYDLAFGSYFLELINENRSIVEKIVLK